MSGVGVVLAGGLSMRYSGAAQRTKALAEIGGAPLIGHVAAKLARHCSKVVVLTGANHDEFIETLGLVKGERSFANLAVTWSDDAETLHPLEFRKTPSGCGSAGRLLFLNREEVGEANLLSYTDVLSNADPARLIDLIRRHDATLAMTAVNPISPWGEIRFDGDRVTGFQEKALDRTKWINGGLFAFSSALLDCIANQAEMLESETLPSLVARNQVRIMRHGGFWRSVETIKDRVYFDIMGTTADAPWADYSKLRITSANESNSP